MCLFSRTPESYPAFIQFKKGRAQGWYPSSHACPYYIVPQGCPLFPPLLTWRPSHSQQYGEENGIQSRGICVISLVLHL